MKKLTISCIVLMLGLAGPFVRAEDNSKTTESIEELGSLSEEGVEDDPNAQSASDYGRLLRLQSRRGVKVFYENEMRVVVQRVDLLICIDPD